MKTNYWSCTKFADWVRGVPKIKAGTAKEWSDWERTAKKMKFRYWLAEEVLDSIHDIVSWPKNLLNEIRHYINNRWVSKTHALNSSLMRGQWHEFDTRLT